MTQDRNSTQIKVLLIGVIVALIVGLIIYPEYRDYRAEQELDRYIASQEASNRNQLETEITLLQADTGDWSISFEEIKAMSIADLEYTKEKLEWRLEYDQLVRTCGDQCPAELTWDNYVLSKTFER